MRSLRALGTTLVLLAVAAAGQTAPQPETKLSADDYVIFNAVLKQAFVDGKFDQIVLLDQTSAGMPPGAAGMTHFGIRDKAFWAAFSPVSDRFTELNKTHLPLDPAQLSCPPKCTLVDAKTSGTFFEDNGGYWQAYYKKFPKSQGLTYISRVVYTSDGKTAFVYLNTMSQALAGVGQLFMMEKKQDGWTISSSQVIWVS